MMLARLPLVLLPSVFLWINVLAAPVTAPNQSDFLPKMVQPLLDEYMKPEYAVSRCMLSPVLATDNLSVALSVDRAFSSGDVLLAVGNESVDANAKTPVRDLLMKHNADETVPIRVRREGKELLVSAKCGDSKAFNDLILEGVFAASKNDAAGCADKFNAAKKLHALTYSFMFVAFHCARVAGRLTTPDEMNRGYYDAYRMVILTHVWSVDALSQIRGDLLAAVDVLRKKNATLLADDLKQQYDQALSAKSQSTTAPVSQ
jgi:hypothetical protein